MTYDQYWYGDACMVRAFYKAEKLRKQERDYQAWVSGLYIKEAIESTVGNMFKKQGTPPIEYPEKPYYMQAEEQTEAAREKEKQEQAFAKLYMYNMMRAGKEWGQH